MDPDDRDRAIVAYRLDEITVVAAYDADDAWSADSSDPVAIMEHVDPELVAHIDMAIETRDQEELDLLLGVQIMASASTSDAHTNETALMLGDPHLTLSALEDDTVIVLDTGCTVHTKRNVKGGFHIRTVAKQEVVAFDGRAMQIHHKFDMSGTVQDKHGQDKCKLTLSNLNHVPNSRFNLFSASQAVNQGWEVHVNCDRALVSKGKQTLTLDRLIKTGSSQLYALKLVPEGTQMDVINVNVDESNILQKTENAKNNKKDASDQRSPDLCKRAAVVIAAKPTSQKARKITR